MSENEGEGRGGLEDWSSADLLERWAHLIASIAGMKVKAAAARRPRDRNAAWAAVHSMEADEARFRAEVYRRMGVPADFKKPGQSYYAASRHGRCCSKCGSSGGMHGRFLHWYVEGFPLAYSIAEKGGTSAQVKEAVKQSTLLCNKCAQKAGVQFTAAGKPRL